MATAVQLALGIEVRRGGAITLTLAMKSIILLLLLPLLFALDTSAEEYKAPDTAGDPIEVTRQLYTDLMKFKDDAKFHESGFAPSIPKTKYRLWYEAYERANKDARYNKALMAKGFAFRSLYMLGMEYMKSKGKPTEYSKYITDEYIPALKR